MSVYGFYKTAHLVHFLHKDNQRIWKDKHTYKVKGSCWKVGIIIRR